MTRHRAGWLLALLFSFGPLVGPPPASAQCATQVPIDPNAAVSGALAPGDCTIAQFLGDASDTSFVDRYVVTLPTSGRLTVQLESTAFDAFLWLLDSGLNVITVDDDGGGNLNALISLNLAAGAYVILANAVTAGEAGSYTLTSTFGDSPGVLAAVLPASRSVQVGTAATAFATVINQGPNVATACGITLLTELPATFDFQATDPATNAVTGAANTPTDIADGAAQSYVLAITPTAAFEPTDVELRFDCGNTAPASVTLGLNTLLVSAEDTPVPDIVALGATATNDGIVNIPGPTGTGAFAVATVNVGAAGTITVSADTGAVALPVTLTLCETNPATGRCVKPAAPASTPIATNIAFGATPTFAVFVTGNGPVAFNPAHSRIFLRFKDAGGVTRGSTSVAARTSG